MKTNADQLVLKSSEIKTKPLPKQMILLFAYSYTLTGVKAVEQCQF